MDGRAVQLPPPRTSSRPTRALHEPMLEIIRDLPRPAVLGERTD